MKHNNFWTSVAFLVISTFTVFFAVQLFFKNTQYFYFSDYQYLLATAVANSFVITSIHALVGARNMLSVNKISTQDLTFFKVYKSVFWPGIMASAICLLAIAAYFYFLDPQAIELIKNQYLDYSLLNAETMKESADYDMVIERIQAAREVNLLNVRVLLLAAVFILFFHISLALMITFLWKVRTPKASKS